MNGLTTGNTLYDLLILVGMPALVFLANRYGLGWLLVLIGEQLVKLKPAPAPDAPRPVEPTLPVAPVNGQPLTVSSHLPGKPVAFEWIALIQLLLPIILQLIEMFRQQTGRMPTAKEVSEIQTRVVLRYLRGEPLDGLQVDEFIPVQMPTVPPVVE
jgi:hypothetical protein